MAIMSKVRMSKTFTDRSREMLASKAESALTASPARFQVMFEVSELLSWQICTLTFEAIFPV